MRRKCYSCGKVKAVRYCELTAPYRNFCSAECAMKGSNMARLAERKCKECGNPITQDGIVRYEFGCKPQFYCCELHALMDAGIKEYEGEER